MYIKHIYVCMYVYMQFEGKNTLITINSVYQTLILLISESVVSSQDFNVPDSNIN